MHDRRVRIDPIHARAIANEVAEGLRLNLPKQQPEPGRSLQKLIDRLSELDQASPTIVPE
jgi:hypothetical protein